MPLVRASCPHDCLLRRPKIFSGRDAPMIHSRILMPQKHVTPGSELLLIKSTGGSLLEPSGTPIRLIMSLLESPPDPSRSLSFAHGSQLQFMSLNNVRTSPRAYRHGPMTGHIRASAKPTRLTLSDPLRLFKSCRKSLINMIMSGRKSR